MQSIDKLIDLSAAKLEKSDDIIGVTFGNTRKTNVIGTLNMQGLAKRVGARILLTSTSEVYGDPLGHPQEETYSGNVLGAVMMIDEGKRIAETLMFDYHRQHGIDVELPLNNFSLNCINKDGLSSSGANSFETFRSFSLIQGEALCRFGINWEFQSSYIYVLALFRLDNFQNMDYSLELCNGTQLDMTKLSTHVLECKILIGHQADKKVLILRKNITPSDLRVAFKFHRRQFPLMLPGRPASPPMGSKSKAKKSKEEKEVKESNGMELKEAQEHIGTLKKLQEKDPEFYEFLKEHDKELLEFDEDDLDDNAQTDPENEDEEKEETDADDDGQSDGEPPEAGKLTRNVITSEMVDSWCEAIHSGSKLGAVRSLMRAFRSACHYGDDEQGDDVAARFSTMSSAVFNKIMVFVLNEMDGILRGLLRLPPSGGKREMMVDVMTSRPWKNYNHLVKSYLGNALHVLNQMTDSEMIAFVLRRLKYSALFLAAFPALLRKYIKVALHFWGTGTGALPLVSFLFLRDCCVRLGSDCLDDCVKGMYKAYVLNCHFINTTKLQHIQFLGNCFTELLRIDTSSAYQHAFVYIRQLAMILKETLSCSTQKKKLKNKGNNEPSGSKKEKGKEAPSSSKKKETYRKVYQWKYINCLELWTGVVCAYSEEADLKPLTYPLAQIITGVARLLPSACYFPLRLRCVRMLNRISASTGTYIPVSLVLLDMLEIKELHRPPTGGLGKSVDLFSILKVSKTTLKTRAFQEACVLSVVEELAEHLAQWSYSIAFLEFSFVPGVRLRNFCKSTKVDRFRKEMRHLIRQIEANSEFINKKRTTVSFLPNDPAAETFLEDEKKLGISPLSSYVATLRQRAQDRNKALMESSVRVGDRASKFGNKTSDDEDDEDDDSEDEESASLLLPGQNTKNKHKENVENKKMKKKNIEPLEVASADEDIIEDFVLSSDDEDYLFSGGVDEEDSGPEAASPEPHGKKRKKSPETLKEKAKKPGKRKSKKRKRAPRKM
ncbi:nucleolar complex protein 2 homolog [Striga asiatica]|uniref:Nucleolar complex protein 2 homolog n=1 Tax=Striga asiatica TaxID=4170 RepID=A0A5A7NXI3_STRAF|nr:nucleolar complex protein 2 homolog [Striga asiatica]